MLEIIKYTIENLVNRKSRSFLTIVSIMIGIAAIFIFSSFGAGLYMYVGEIAESQGLDKFMVQGRSMGAPGLDDAFRLEDKDFRAIERTKGVKDTTAWYMKVVEVERDDVRKYVFLAGVLTGGTDIEILEQMMAGSAVNPGRQFEKNDRGKVVLGYNYRVPDKIFSKSYSVGDRIKINGVNFDIIGFYESIGNPQDDSNIYMVEDDVKELFGDDIPYAILIGQVVNIDDMDKVVERVERNLRKARDVDEGEEDFSIQSFTEAYEMFTSVLNIVVGFIFLIVVISGFVASINTANTMVTSVLERVQEIGVMKAIGAKNSKIRNIFLIESGMLGFVAGVFGAVVGWALSFLGGKILSNLGWSFLMPRFPWWLFVICIGIATVVGAVSGVFPAIYASKQNVVDALRYE